MSSELPRASSRSRSEIGGPVHRTLTLWSAADRGDTEKVRELLESGSGGSGGGNPVDVNARNCLGCTPLLYASGSGHVDTVRFLLGHPEIDVNRRNNDRLTSFMLAMQGGALFGRAEASWPGWENETTTNAQEKMKRLMDLPATDDLEWTRHDRWTALMEACNFGHQRVVELLVMMPNIDFEAVNLRGQKAQDVAVSRGHEHLADVIEKARNERENPEELPQIQELEQQVENLKLETRQRLLQAIEQKYAKLQDVKAHHEREISPLSRKIDLLQEHLEEAMKQRFTMITKQVREVKAVEEEIKQVKRKLENFDRYASSNNLVKQSEGAKKGSNQGVTGSSPDLSCFEKDFECSVCLEEMKPPVKIFQCRNGHVMCEACKDHPEVHRCPSCRMPLNGQGSLMRNIPMEKLSRSYYEREGSGSTPSLGPRSNTSLALSPRSVFLQSRVRRGSGPQGSSSNDSTGSSTGARMSGLSSSVNDVSYLDWMS